MKKLLLSILVISPFLFGCNSMPAEPKTPDTPKVQNGAGNKASSDAEKTQANEAAAKKEEYGEPVLSDHLSRNPADADGKKLLRCEYRYLHKDGDFLSVVADFRGPTKLDIVEMSSQDAEPKIYHKGKYVHVDNKFLDKLLHKLHGEGRLTGPLMWADAPERTNWREDDSTTWIIVDYDGVQFVISSRMDLPAHRYHGFHSIYTWMTSLVSGFNRKMRQNIGEPADILQVDIHGKSYRLVPGTGSSDGISADVDCGDKKWWIEEEYVGEYITTPIMRALEMENSEGGNEEMDASMRINPDGTFDLTVDGLNLKGRMLDEWKYNVDARGYVEKQSGKSTTGIKLTNRFWIKYTQDKAKNENGNVKEYSRIRLQFDMEPYHNGHYIPSRYIYLEKK